MSNETKIKSSSLRTKVLIPFFVILIALGSAATIGTILIISETLEKTADERLTAFQQQIYQEIRGLEERLLRRTYLLELSYQIDQSNFNKNESKLQRIERLIDESLVTEGMTARYISPSAAEKYHDPKLGELLNHARTSKKQQLRFTTDIGKGPALTLVRPLFDGSEIVQYIVLQAVTDNSYLQKISAPLNLKTALYDLNGNLLITSDKQHDFSQLSTEVMVKVLDGQRVYSSPEHLLKRRNLIYAIPLGTTDMLIAQLEMPLTDVSLITGALATRSAISIFIAMLIGGYIYYRLISQVIKPAQDMMLATRAIGEGNLDYRIDEIHGGEFGELATSFNNMMQNISNLYSEQIKNERELTKAQEELKYKEILEEKNRRIEQVNAEMKVHLKELSTLLQLNQAMASTLDLNILFDRAINSLSDLLDCHVASLLLYNPGEDLLSISHTLGIDRESLENISFSLNEGISGAAARSREPIYVRDVSSDQRYLNYKGKVESRGSLLSMPLLSKNRLCGVLNLHKKETDGFSDVDISLANAVANQAAIAIENSQLYRQAREQSITDELTGLANRRHFQEIFQREINHANRYATNLSIIMADIDHFKSYNDTHGHLQGDVALKKVADLLLQNTRGIDLAARFGGEEFVILLPKTSIEGARITAEKLREMVLQENFLGAAESQPGGQVTISLGVACYPEHTDNLEQLLEIADQALYRAKGNGRNQVAVWNDNLA